MNTDQRGQPENWNQITRFDGPEDWGMESRWKGLFPKSGSPRVFVGIDAGVNTRFELEQELGLQPDQDTAVLEMNSSSDNDAWDSSGPDSGGCLPFLDAIGKSSVKKPTTNSAVENGVERRELRDKHSKSQTDKKTYRLWRDEEKETEPCSRSAFRWTDERPISKSRHNLSRETPSDSCSSEEEKEFSDTEADIIFLQRYGQKTKGLTKAQRSKKSSPASPSWCIGDHDDDPRSGEEGEDDTESDGIYDDLSSRRNKYNSGGYEGVELVESRSTSAKKSRLYLSSSAGRERGTRGKGFQKVKPRDFRDGGCRRETETSSNPSYKSSGVGIGSARKRTAEGPGKSRRKAIPASKDKDGWVHSKGRPSSVGGGSGSFNPVSSFSGSEASLRENRDNQLVQQKILFNLVVVDDS